MTHTLSREPCCLFWTVRGGPGTRAKQVTVPLQITVLQLSALLKQADSSKRKLTLTRLASAPVPFTVLSLTGNPCKEDYLAVCGLKVKSSTGVTPRAVSSDQVFPGLSFTFSSSSSLIAESIKATGVQRSFSELSPCFLIAPLSVCSGNLSV